MNREPDSLWEQSLQGPPPEAEGRKIEWKPVFEAGVTLDGVWVTAGTLDELQELTHNTEITGYDPLLVNLDVKRVLVAHGLAQAQTRGGIYAGPRIAEFMAGLEWPPQPGSRQAGPVTCARAHVTSPGAHALPDEAERGQARRTTRQWNILAPVVALIPAGTAAEAITLLRERLSRAGFDVYDGEPGCDAFESEDTGEARP